MGKNREDWEKTGDFSDVLIKKANQCITIFSSRCKAYLKFRRLIPDISLKKITKVPKNLWFANNFVTEGCE